MLLANATNAQQVFHDFTSFLKYAESKSISLKNADIKSVQAKKAKLAAKIGIIDPQISLNSSFIDNLKLGVTLLPADAFGGQPGISKAIQMGSPYQTNVTQMADIKLFNFEGLKNYDLAKINIDISSTDVKLTRKSLYENIATSYYNIVLLNEQQKSTQKNIAISDSLYQITKNKYEAGLVKQQDVNDSRVNLLNLQENEKQIAFQMEQNYITLKILADIPENEQFSIDEKIVEPGTEKPTIQKNVLSKESALYKEKYALTDYKKQKSVFIPTLSFVGSFQYNHYSQDFKISGNDWFNSRYVGLKLGIPLPNAKTISNRINAKYNYELAIQNTQQAEIKAELDYKKLDIEWNKNYSQLQTNTEIAAIQNDTYQKNKNLYKEGLQSLDKTLNSLNTKVNAEYNLNSSKVNLQLSKVKIDINNQIN